MSKHKNWGEFVAAEKRKTKERAEPVGGAELVRVQRRPARAHPQTTPVIRVSLQQRRGIGATGG